MGTATSRKWHYLPTTMLLISMISGLYIYQITLDEWVTNNMKDNLTDLLSDIAYEIHEDNPNFPGLTSEDITEYINHLPQATNEKRISIIAEDGTVLGDSSISHRELSTLENHANRAEINIAFTQGSGFDIRYSSTLGINMLYVATLLPLHNSTYVVRLSMPMTLLKSMSSDLMTILFILMSSSVLIMIVSTVISIRRIDERIKAEKDLQEERIQQRTFQIELLHRLANMLAACNSFTEAQKVIADIVPRILGDINGCVSLMRNSRNQLTIKLDWGQQWPAAMSYSPQECWALRRGKYHLSNDTHHSLPCSHNSDVGDDQILCIPLTAHGNTIGILHLYFGDKNCIVSQETRQLAFTVAEHLGLALANLSLQEKLRTQALIDPLTGLFNRRHFETTIEEQLMLAKRDEKPLSLLMLDLDHFKRFNDNFGHDAGDYVLKEISRLLIDTVDTADIVCRLGGEELAVLTPHLNAEHALTLAKRLCHSVEKLHLSLNSISLGTLTVSIGIATFPDSNVNKADMVKYADVALYKAKDQGRNRAIHYLHDPTNVSPPLELHPVKDRP
jgi:diguanylate cyclase (GGDEF)-like protein